MAKSIAKKNQPDKADKNNHFEVTGALDMDREYETR